MSKEFWWILFIVLLLGSFSIYFDLLLLQTLIDAIEVEKYITIIIGG